MIDASVIENLTSRLSGVLPEQFDILKNDIESNLRAVLQSFFNDMHLVNRDEFDLQVQRLSRMREQLAQLEERIRQLESAE